MYAYRAIILLLAIPLSGCGFSGTLLSPLNQPLVPPPGDRIVIENGRETIEPVEPVEPESMCQARARFFRGTVSIPCVQIGRTIAP